jgi:hypothetical protein
VRMRDAQRSGPQAVAGKVDVGGDEAVGHAPQPSTL